MKFEEIYDAAVEGRTILSPENKVEVILERDGLWYTKDEEKVDFKPVSYSLDTWQIKPEEIFVWGVCDEREDDFLSDAEFIFSDNRWCMNPVASWYQILNSKNTFPTDTPQKYKLTPVEDS